MKQYNAEKQMRHQGLNVQVAADASMTMVMCVSKTRLASKKIGWAPTRCNTWNSVWCSEPRLLTGHAVQGGVPLGRAATAGHVGGIR